MDENATITVLKQPVYMPVTIIGKDDQDRTVITCPFCGDDAIVEEDGHVACPTGEALGKLLAGALPGLLKAAEL